MKALNVVALLALSLVLFSCSEEVVDDSFVNSSNQELESGKIPEPSNIIQRCKYDGNLPASYWLDCDHYYYGEFWVTVDLGYAPNVSSYQWYLDNGNYRLYYEDAATNTWNCISCFGKAISLPNGNTGVVFNLTTDFPYTVAPENYNGPGCLNLAYSSSKGGCKNADPTAFKVFEVCYDPCHTSDPEPGPGGPF